METYVSVCARLQLLRPAAFSGCETCSCSPLPFNRTS